MTNLIALIDGSVYSESVCDYTVWAAQRLDASVDVLHVLGRRGVKSEPVNLSGSIGLGARTALLEELAELDAQRSKLAQKRGRLLIDDAKARIEAAGIAHVEAKLRIGDIVDTIEVFERDSDLLVIGKRGDGAEFAKGHLGSNLERILRSVHKPVLVTSREFKPVKRVLIAFDGGPTVMKAIEFILANKLFDGVSISLLTVASSGAAEVRSKQEAAATRLSEAGLAVDMDVTGGQAASVIAARCSEGAYDMLVMGAYGHSRVRSLIIGSTTSEMIRNCGAPVMLFR